MPTRHGRKLSYHLLLPLHLEDELMDAAKQEGVSVARYASLVIEQHLATMQRQPKVPT